MLLMKLKSFSYFISLLIIFFHSPLLSEEKIDIWKSKKEITNDKPKLDNQDNQMQLNLKSSQTLKALEKIEIQEGSTIQSDEPLVYGIFEPSNFNLNLNMWSRTNAEDLRSSLKRLKKIELSV